MARDRETWGETYVYDDWTLSKTPIKDKKLIFYCSIEENNEPYRFMRKGPEAEMYIKMDNEVDKSKIVSLIIASNIDMGIKKSIERLFKRGELEPGTHRI